MSQRIDDIHSADWSPQVGNPGEVVEDNADIEQCIGIILNTRKGSVSHRPLFGCDAWQYLDQPLTRAVPAIVNEVVSALELWEPRITVSGVSATITGAGSATITVNWQPLNGQLTTITEVTLGSQ